MKKPVWFYDNDVQDVILLLRWFVSRLKQDSHDQLKPLKKILKPKDLPGLFEYSNLDKRDFIIEVIYALSLPPYEIWDVSEDGNSFVLVLDPKSEGVLRKWLDMPLVPEMELAWRNELDLMADQLGADLYSKLNELGYPGGYLPVKIIRTIKKLSNYLNSIFESQSNPSHVFSWRQLSARFFEGDSKYLDTDFRRIWLSALFPHLTCLIKERTVPVSVVLAVDAQQVLFVENWDSFCWLANISDIRSLYHLVYTAGFKASAKEIREKHAVSFFYAGEHSSRDVFEAFWFARDKQLMSSYFWGDLDFSGLQILESLVSQFPGLTAWVPGYQPMVNALIDGAGHRPVDAGKNNQIQVANLTCEYAKNILHKSLVDTGLMLDQEWLSEDALLPVLALD